MGPARDPHHNDKKTATTKKGGKRVGGGKAGCHSGVGEERPVSRSVGFVSCVLEKNALVFEGW